jgi:hypothetical protein
MSEAPTAIRTIERLGAGRYRVPSETTAGQVYSIQLDMIDYTGGVCNCQGYEGARRKGNACKHLRAALAAEQDYTMTENESTAVATRDRDVPPAALVVAPMHTISMFPSEPELNMIVQLAAMAIEAGADFVPRNVKTKAQAIAIILAGREVGLKPLTSLRHINCINGKTDLEARGMMGVCIANDPNIRFETTEYTHQAVTIVMHRPGVLKTPLAVRYTVDEAKKSGQMAKAGPWQTYTRDMLFAAAAKRCCRIGAPDLINGIDAAMQTEEQGAEIDRETSVRIIEPTPAQLPDTSAAATALRDMPGAMNEGDDGSMPIETQPPTSTDQRRRLRELLTEAKTTTDSTFWGNLLLNIRETFPEAHASDGRLVIAKLTDEQVMRLADGVAVMLHGDGPPPPADDEAIDG